MQALKKLPQNNIKVKGWLERQLILQAEGLSGNIQKYFPDLSNDSAWLGGTGEAWERGPYYLDGLVPLAFLLNDKELIQKVYVWIEAILASKNNYVGFGPLRNVDYWPRMVAQKALISFYRATSDQRVIDFLLDYYKFMLKSIDKSPPYYWAAARALEGLEAMLTVYEITQDSAIPSLIQKLVEYGYDWFAYFNNFEYPKPMTKYTIRPIFKLGKAIAEPIDQLIKQSQRIPKYKSARKVLSFNQNALVKLISLTHGVNIAMAYKYPVYYGAFMGDKKLIELAKRGFEKIMKRHGLSIGLHSSDEHLMGSDASQGVELCTVAEQLYSFEEALRITQDSFYADMAEFYIFNAFPATFTQDMTAHQYVQQPNQIAADRKARQFFDTNKEANIFGIAPNFGCCAANMHQGFPKFAENLVYHDGKKLYFLLYSPCEITTDCLGQNIHIKEITQYPFEDKVLFEIVKADKLDIVFRIPKFTKSLTLNGKSVDFVKGENIELNVNGGDKVELLFEDKLEIVNNPDSSISIKRNNILLAMPLPFEERYVRGERPFHYREFVPKGDFNFSPVITDGGLEITDIKRSFNEDLPFDRNGYAFEYIVKAKQITNWTKKYNSASSPPLNPVTGQQQNISLVPYGNTYLRIAQFADLRKRT